jgi:hypothetical protein
MKVIQLLGTILNALFRIEVIVSITTFDNAKEIIHFKYLVILDVIFVCNYY